MVTIGQEFQDERKSQGLSLEEVAKATKIKQEFLQLKKAILNRFRLQPTLTVLSVITQNFWDFLLKKVLQSSDVNLTRKKI